MASSKWEIPPMKLLILILFSFNAHAYFNSVEQYPEDRTYTSADQGHTQYGAPSLYKSGKYSLTFDDGPDPVKTPLLLNLLKNKNVKAMFFVVTSQINETTFPIIKRMLDEGHLVGSHGRTHDNSNKITKTQWKSRVTQSFLDLAKWYKKAGHTFNKPFYRFPYAAYGKSKDHHHMNTLKEISKELMGDNCIQFAFWDIDSGDWIPKMSAQEVFMNLKSSNEGGSFITYKTINGKILKVHSRIDNPTSGGVILNHDIQPNNVETMKLFIDYAEKNHLDLIRLDDVEEFKVTKNCELKR
jgi:peptidoglycan/xylan/chitin deacetylase (PgdA/CDA1 family)